MATGPSAASAALRLAADIRAREATPALLGRRLGAAAALVDELRTAEPVRAALVVGSTALRRCGARSDLDLVLIADAAGDEPRFESREVADLHVEIERITTGEAMATTGGAEGWTFELRAASRLGCGLPVFDPDGLARRLRKRAAAAAPCLDRCESVLRGVYVQLAELGAGTGFGAGEAEAVRGVVDNLALLTLLTGPRRYQKPKWVLADLIDAGELGLVDAIVAAYGIEGDDPNAAQAAVRRTRALIDAAYRDIGVPPHPALLAMGYAPQYAEASYVSRTLADAVDLADEGRAVEAQYVAKAAARLAAALIDPAGAGGSLDGAVHGRSPALASLYRDVFAAAPAPDRTLLETALAVADARLAELEARLAADASRAIA